MTTRSFCLLGLLAGLVLAIPLAKACAPAPRFNESVSIDTETALIIWDPQTKVQHFIRGASFRSSSADFGFLVPTPTKPELAEATTAPFLAMEHMTAPRTEIQTVDPPIGCPFGTNAKSTFMAGAAAPSSPPVQVLEQKRVGGYDAAVLKAEDPQALLTWLKENGYDARPQLLEWLKAYTSQKWIVTAFKIAADKASTNGPVTLNSSPVRMTFPTERPFFPYREPADQRLGDPRLAAPRSLKVYLLAEGRMRGKLGDDSQLWPGQTLWANPLTAQQVSEITRPLKLTEAQTAVMAGRTWWLTEFDDRSSPRPGTDEVYFDQSSNQATVERPPNIKTVYREYPLWAALTASMLGPLILVAILAWVTRKLMRPKAK